MATYSRFAAEAGSLQAPWAPGTAAPALRSPGHVPSGQTLEEEATMPPGLAPESQAPWPGRVPAAALPGGQRPGRRPRRGKPVWTPGGRCGNGTGAQVSPASIPEDAGHLLSARRRPPPAPRPPTPSVTPTSRPLPRRARRADALQPDPRPPRRRRSEGGRLPRPTLPWV